MTTHQLELQPPGTLARPGPIGRIARTVVGAACLYGIFELMEVRESVISAPVSHLDNLIVLLLAPFVAFNPMVNIGYSRNWGPWPLRVLLVVLLIVALAAWGITGQADNAWFGSMLWLFLVYFYAHLGISFVLSAAIASPGCEMRSLHHLLGRLTNRPVREHACPAFLDRLDRWEARRSDQDA